MFDFGVSKSRANSSSQSSSYGYETSFSDSLSQAASRSDQRIAFEDVIAQLYGDAQGATKRAAGMVPLFQGQTAALFDSGTDILERLGTGAGEDYLGSRLTDNTARDAQLDVLGERLGTMFREEINPALTSRHVAGGTLGGGRQGVAQGVAAGKIAREFAGGAADILARDQEAKDSAAAQLAQAGNVSSQIGLAAIPGLVSTAQAGLGAPLSPYTALSSIIGAPTVLGSSSSEEVAAAISRALGEDFSQSSSKSSSKSGSFSFGLF